MTSDRPTLALGRWLCGAPLIALLAAMPSHAQYKVIGPDGKVTYTDRAPQASQGKVTALGIRNAVGGGDTNLPLELRQAVSRYPVTLYVATGGCEPCDSARQQLRQRGIPYAEKQVQGQEDAEAFERLTGGRDAPTLMIGSQTLRGFAPEVWSSYLDAAGYPRESKLPPTYSYAPPTPIVERREASAAAPRTPAPRAAPVAEVPPPAPPNPSNIKF